VRRPLNSTSSVSFWKGNSLHPNTRSRILRALSARPGETAARWLRRADCQIAFARALAAALPQEASAGGWSELVDRAQTLLDAFDPNAGLFGLSAAVQEAERAMTPIGQAAKTCTVHCVGHGHIDMNWMWSWPETVSVTHDTFASVLSLMDEYPDLTFSQSQASVYALTERYHPDQFKQIKARVAEGRWEVSAVHWVEGDKNLASGESLCRHLLLTRRYFQEKFGLSPADAPLDWEPDTFGHALTVPSFLAQAGVKFYYACRTGGGFDHPVVGEFPRPRLFWWQAPDGSRVLVNREATWYNSYVNIGDNIALPLVDFLKETGLRDWLNVYGIGNHGGGPTRVEIDYLLEMRDWPIYPNVVFSTAKRWFETVESALAPSLPVLDHELNFEFTGCYTSQSLIKQANRLGENFCEEAETLAALAARLGGPAYPAERLREAWVNVLFNQFHDILPGSGVRQTREHALGLFQEVGAITGSAKRASGVYLTKEIDTAALLPDTPEAADEKRLLDSGAANTPFVAGAGIGAGLTGYSVASGGGRRFLPFVVYNPCAWPRSEMVTVTLYDTDLDPARIVARDETGTQHPTLFLGRGNDWGHDKITVLFPARDIPALGYRTYLFCEGLPDAETPLVQALPGDMFETPHLKFLYDRYTSGFRLLQTSDGTDLVGNDKTSFGAWENVIERPRGMTSWVLGEEIEPSYILLSSSFHVLGAARNQGTNVVGGNSIAYRIDQTLGIVGTQSTVRLSTLIHALEPRVDVTAEVDWREIGDSQRGIPGLVVRFPFDFFTGDMATRYEAPFGSVERHETDGREVPTLRYAHIGGTAATWWDQKFSFGFTLLQDCKYGHFKDKNDIGLRIIRSSFDPDHAPEVCKQTVRYSMYFHEGEADPATLTRLGAAWNHPLIVFPANLQTGAGAAARSFVQVETPNVVLSALKQAEDGSGDLILRLVELNGREVEAVVAFDPELAAQFQTAALVDLMEQPLAENAGVPFTRNELRAPVRANSFITVRLASG